VLGLMLGTAIISSALVTGDTMSHTVRASVERSLGETDELVSVRQAEIPAGLGLENATRTTYFSERLVPRVDRALRRTGLVDGVAPAIIEPVAVQDADSRQNEPRVTLFATDPELSSGFSPITGDDGTELSLADLGPGEVYLNADAADELDARAGHSVAVLAGRRLARARVKDVVRYDGAGTDGPAVLLPLDRAQALLGRPGEIKHIVVSNRDEAATGDRVQRAARPVLAPLGLEADTVKKDGLEAADQQGDLFMSVFGTFGSFSIFAGILLIFLIFVMLAAERRSELGIARAVGTRRGHLVQMFVFEGVAYDLGAAAIGALLGVAVAFGMVSVLAQAFSTFGLDVEHDLQPRSLVVAYTLGVLLTFVVVAVSAWRVSRLNIVSAVRNLPEPLSRGGGKRRVLTGALGVLLGIAITASGLSGGQAMPFMLGVSLVILGGVRLARVAGAPDRAVYTIGGVLLLVWWLLPFDVIQTLAGKDLSMDFSMWIVSGLLVVAGSTWLIVYNADLLLGVAARGLGRIRSLAPVLKMAMAYPLRGRFRTGITLAMFTLVVFTVVVGATTSGAFLSAVDDVDEFGGGFDARAEVAPASPLADPAKAVRSARGLRASDFEVVASGSFVPAEARQSGTGAKFEGYPVRGFDDAFLDHTTYGLGAIAKGYGSARKVFDAMASRPGLAVVDAFVVPRRSNFNFAPPSPFGITGFYVEDKTFDPVTVIARDPRTGKRTRLTVIGVLKDTAPYELAGLWTSQDTARAAFGAAATPNLHYFELAPGVDADDTARRLESAFLANGMQADSIEKVLRDAIGANYTLNWLLLGFMGLGLVVGVAALGVISARSVVERRQQIGVLRSIGFRRDMVRLSFLLESSFIALTSIVVGTALGLAIAYNVVADSQGQAGWDNLHFVVPWLHLGIVFFVVYAAALLTTLAPATRASRVFPAQALRYE
jgi:putative ABC transport system permease protein